MRVWPEEGETLEFQGDLILVRDDTGLTHLYRTVETYMRPQQSLIDKVVNSEQPYHFDTNTMVFRILEDLGSKKVTDDAALQELLGRVPAL